MENDELILKGQTTEVPRVQQQLGEILLDRIRQQGDRVAVVMEIDGVELTLTFSEILRHSFVAAKFLREHNVGFGDTIMVCCESVLEFHPLFLGTLMIGASCSPVDPNFTESEFAHLLEVIEPKMVFCEDVCHSVVTAVASTHTDVIRLPDMARVFQQAEKDVEEIIPVQIDDLENHPALVMTSSGTTGRPKGVEIGHAALTYLFAALPFPPEFVVLASSGPYWGSAMYLYILIMSTGAKLVLIGMFSEKKFCELVQKHQVAFTTIGSVHMVALAKWRSQVQYDLSSLMYFGCHGGRISEAMLEVVENRFGVAVSQGFGMTELWSSLMPPFNRTDKKGSVGSLSSNVQAKVVDVDTGRPLGPNCEGEICLRSPAVFKRYRKNPEATAAIFDADGFLHTGDIGYYDQEGYFYIVDRIKDFMKYTTYQVSAVEIEEILFDHPDVLEAAVVGIPHEELNELPTAFVVRRPGSSLSAEELTTLVQGRLPQKKWLHGGVEFMTSLPRTASGKVKKRELRTNFVASRRTKL